ncbi:MAG: helix-turn-helix transcriptional regulator [Clostridium sp.]
MRRKLKNLRIKNGYKTQPQFARALGISLRTYQNIEYSITFPRQKLLYKILKLLKTEDLSIFNNEINEWGSINKNICALINEQTDRNFTIYHMDAIRKSISKEKEDRRKNELKIKYNNEGKKLILKRIADIVNRDYRMDITYKDIQLFKNCVRAEFEIRTGKSTWGLKKDIKKGCEKHGR